MTVRPHGERRAFRRLGRVHCALWTARLRPGGDVEIRDLSEGGAAIDRAPRLLPGSMVQLHLAIPGWQGQVAARVVRCRVSGLSADSGMFYVAGLSFERPVEGLLGGGAARARDAPGPKCRG